MTVEQGLREAAQQLKKNPQKYIDKLMQFSDKVLERKLDIVREQKQMAYDQQKKESFELLAIKEDLIIKIRLIKSENETEKHERKPKKKKLSEERTEEFQNSSVQTDNSVTAGTAQTADNSDNNKKNNKPKQLTLDF